MKFTIAVAALTIAQAANAAPVVLTGTAAYTQDFNGLVATGTGTFDSLPTGVQISETGSNANTTYAAGDGGSNTGNTYSFGTGTSTDRALGTLRSGNLIPSIGIGFKNETGQTITGFTISYTGEQWRLGTAGRADRLDFQYAVGSDSITFSGPWVDVNALDFSSPITSGPLGALNGNAAANRTAISSTINLSIANNTSFVFRWSDFDATGADDGLAIDDFSLTPIFATAAVPEPSTWAMMIGGFGLIGASLRRRNRRALVAA